MLANVYTFRNDSKYQKYNPVTLERTGGRGRPRMVINRRWLEDVLATRLSIASIARAANVSPKTVFRNMDRLGLTREFTALSDDDLDQLIKAYKVEKPTSGNRFIAAYLHLQGMRIQRERIRLSAARVDALGAALRHDKTITRREYSVPRTNHLWHCDGHHKLITWGIVIHGCIDGYDHTVRRCSSTAIHIYRTFLNSVQVVSLRASTNNRADTVLVGFLEAVEKYGCPSRVRGDRGGENTEVAVYMIMRRGAGRASFMWGS